MQSRHNNHKMNVSENLLRMWFLSQLVVTYYFISLLSYRKDGLCYAVKKIIRRSFCRM